MMLDDLFLAFQIGHRTIAKGNYRERNSCPIFNLKWTILEITMLKFSGTSLKMTILRNFLIFHFFGKIFTHASMGDCFFSMRPLCPPRTRMSLGKKANCIYMQLMCEWDCGGGGGKAAIFTSMLIWGDLTSHRIAKTNLTWQVIWIARSIQTIH